MNILKEAQSAFDFAIHCPLLYKATADSDSAVPGYIYEEIIKISFLSHQHRQHLLDFLLAKLSNCGWGGKQKVVKILHQLCERGHYEVRMILRHRDGELREAASHGGSPDPVLANTPQLFFNSSINDLLRYIFEESTISRDNELSAKGDSGETFASMGGHGGYGAKASQGKYIGFGNTPFNKPEGLVDQMREMVGKVVTPESRKREELEEILKSDKGNYLPLLLQGAAASLSASCLPSPQKTVTLPLYSSVISHRSKAYIAGKVGGSWDDEASEYDPSSLTAEGMTTLVEMPAPSSLTYSSEFDHDAAVMKILHSHTRWPVDVDHFVATVKESTHCGVSELLKQIGNILKQKKSDIQAFKQTESTLEGNSILYNYRTPCIESEIGSTKPEHAMLVLLLFIEYGLHEDLLPVNLLSTYIQSILVEITQDAYVNDQLKAKAKKINLILNRILLTVHNPVI